MRAVPLSLSLTLLISTFSVQAQITTRNDAVGKKLNEWFANGESAGLHSLSYENRDGGHSLFDVKTYPQLGTIQHSQEEWAQKRNIGPASIIRQEPVFGNCSMAAPADQGGSLPRLYMISRDGLNFLAGQYLSNNLFFYPEHQDYDPGYHGRGGWGDLYPANIPYLIISQGSSYTDQPFIQSFFSAAAALPKETQQGLIRHKLLIPTLQSIFRHSYNTVQSEEDYFTGKAHPPVFDGSQINEEKMIEMAHAMTPARVPPLAVLEIIDEDKPQPGIDFFEPQPLQSEALATTPFAIARVFRGVARDRHITLSARKSTDILQRNITYRWALLQGDPNRVKIEPSADGTQAQITVQWHPAWEIRPGMQTHRVDIGLFAHNGFTWSAPAILSYYMLPNEQRFYDDAGRIQEVAYQSTNPDLGIPAGNDLRWLALANRLSSKDDDLSLRLLRDQLQPALITYLAKVAAELSPLQEAWRKLQGDPNPDIAARAAESLQMLQTKLQTAIDQPIPPTNTTPVQQIEQAILHLTEDPALFITHQKEANRMLRVLPEADTATFRQSLQHALNLLALGRKADGTYFLHYPPEKLSQGERYQLRHLNLSLLANLFFYDFLDRPQPFAFTIDALTVTKPWRDVYSTDAQGKVLGWSRIGNGRFDQFNAQGKLVQPNTKTTSNIQYSVNGDTKTLQYIPY